jgi:hypothetical protein
MSFQFGDGFDCYATPADAFNGYWDVGSASPTITLVTGRFSGSRAFSWPSFNAVNLCTKTSGQNDAVHHLSVAFQQTAAISGTTLGLYLQLLDGTTGQCAVVFKSNGDILLTAGTGGGAVLATYAGAFTVINTWYQFEFEIVIHNSAGSFKVRKNGNPVDDHSTTGIDTQGSANAYANKLQINQQATVITQAIDDLYWRSDASSVPWMGDIRCYTRAPASDASVQFSRTSPLIQTPFAQSTTGNITLGIARYTPFTALYDGTIGTATVSLNAGYTGNMKCTIFASSGSAPTTVLGSATTITNPTAGANTLTFGTPVSITKGTAYYIGFDSDTTSGIWNLASASTGTQSTTSYASFPVASPTLGAATNAIVCTLTITVGTNNCLVNEAQQDATTSYVYDSVPGHADLYGIAAIASTPLTTYAVTTRAYAIKSDAGTRTMAVQLRSGATTDASPTVVLTPSNWQWAWKHYTSDPAGGAWTAAAVNVAQVGPVVIA